MVSQILIYAVMDYMYMGWEFPETNAWYCSIELALWPFVTSQWPFSARPPCEFVRLGPQAMLKLFREKLEQNAVNQVLSKAFRTDWKHFK